MNISRIYVEVALSDQFLGWIISRSGPGVRITGPDAAVERMREIAARVTEQYAE